MIAYVESADVSQNITRGTRQEVHDDIRYNRDVLQCGVKPGDIVVIRKYVIGEQSCTLTEKQRDILENVLEHLYCDNVCELIISESAGRLQFLGWRCNVDAIKKFLDQLYIQANMRYVSNQVQYDFMRDGNSCASLSISPQKKVRAAREPWWDGQSGVFVVYTLEDTENMKYAVKEWPVLVRGKVDYWRRVVWAEGEIQRWASYDGGTWEPYPLPDDQGWPVRWLKKGGTPMGPPVVHFPNTKSMNISYGMSELSGGFIGAQDQINDLQYVISAASRLTGYQMVTIAGVKKEIDEKTGKEKEVEIGPGAILRSTSADTRYGILPAGDLSQLINAYEHKVKTVMRNARVPLHRIGQGNPPSGDALLRAEGPAIAKAERQVEMCTVRWSTLGHRAVEISNSYGGTAFDEEEFVQAVMEEPDRRDKLSKSVIINNLADNISKHEALRIMEYSEADADKIIKEKIEEAQAMLPVLAATTAATAPPQNNGGGGGGNGTGKPPTNAGGGRQPSNSGSGRNG